MKTIIIIIIIITHLCVNSKRNTSTTNSDNKVLPLQDLLTFFGDISVSIWRTDKNCPPVKVRVWIRVRVILGLAGNFPRDNCPKTISAHQM